MAQFMPGDALTGLNRPECGPSPYAKLREKLGINNPWHIQYDRLGKRIVPGRFRYSLSTLKWMLLN